MGGVCDARYLFALCGCSMVCCWAHKIRAAYGVDFDDDYFAPPPGPHKE